MDAPTRHFAADTHSGLARKRNEDCYGAYPELGLWLVADGVGGRTGGDIASSIVCTTMFECVSRGQSLLSAVEASHQAILSAVAAGRGAAGMGSTVVAVRVTEREFELCWVGDSRAYVWDGRLARLSRDHNHVSELLDRNEITREQAASHPQRHVITQSLGGFASAELVPGHLQAELRPDQYLLLCSDGLTDELSDSLIAHLLADHRTPRAQVDALMSAALDAGGHDNITAVVIGCEALNTAVLDIADPTDTHMGRRNAGAGTPSSGNFPLRALLLVSAIAVAAALLLL